MIVSAKLLQVERVSIQRGDRALLQHVNLSVQAGECYQLIGANGLGKTSMLRVLAGLAEPEAGQINIDDFVYISHKQALKYSLTVMEHCRFHPYLQQIEANKLQQALHEFGLKKYTESTIDKLSQGQKQRLHLLPLLCLDKKLWLLDEPFSGLDVNSIAFLEQKIDQHLLQHGAVLLTSHQSVKLQSRLQAIDLAQYSAEVV